MFLVFEKSLKPLKVFGIAINRFILTYFVEWGVAEIILGVLRSSILDKKLETLSH